jgi:RNase P/RNase MRP subunit p30
LRKYVDAWIRVRHVSLAEALIRRAAMLGFSAVAIEASEIDWGAVKKAASEVGVEVYIRRTISPSSVREMYHQLSEERWRYDFIAVETDQRGLLMAAARDTRVDAVVASLPGLPRIDRHIIAVTNNAIEVCLSHILERGFAAYRRAKHSIQVALRKRIKLVISSGAGDEYALRRPIQLAAIAWASGASLSKALDAVSETPLRVLEDNRARREGRLDAQGVWRVVEE